MGHVEDLLPDYLTGGLSRWEGARVRLHLWVCPRCRAAKGELERALYALARALPPSPPPAGGLERLKARLAWGRRLRAWAARALLLGLLAGALGLVHLGQRVQRLEAALEEVAYWASEPGVRWRPIRAQGQNLGLLLWREDGRCLLLLREGPPPGRAYLLLGEEGERRAILARGQGRVLEAEYRGFRTLVLGLEEKAGARPLARIQLP